MLGAVLRSLPRVVRWLIFMEFGFKASPDLFREEQLKEQFKLEPGWVFVDVGASMGMYTVMASRQVRKTGLVVAIEPHPQSFDFLRFIVSLLRLKNVRVFNVALYSKDSIIDLYLGKEPPLSSVMSDSGFGSMKVRAFALDSLMKVLGIECVNAVKIDVEGAEMEVLRGMEKSIKICKFITVELHGKDKATLVKCFLENEGFSTKRLGKNKKHILGVRK